METTDTKRQAECLTLEGFEVTFLATRIRRLLRALKQPDHSDKPDRDLVSIFGSVIGTLLGCQNGLVTVRQPTLKQEATPDELWAEIYRLRLQQSGPEGYETWQEAAVAERVRRVAAERRVQTLEQQLKELKPRSLSAIDSETSKLIQTARAVARQMTYDDAGQSTTKHLLMDLSSRLASTQVSAHKKQDGVLLVDENGCSRFATLKERLIFKFFRLLPARVHT